jgi:predicted dehydrogenase
MTTDRVVAKINRREFIAETAVIGAGTFAAAHLAAAAPQGANDRLSIGLIGVGGRGSAHLKQLRSLSQECNVAVTAVCDVWQPNLDQAAAAIKKEWGKEPRKGTRFGDLLALKDVDGVVIATPDFAHAPILLAALQAGKDVYVEKPMSIDLDLANQALDLARSSQRVVQAGTQHRSEGPYLAAAKVAASGVLGQISRVTTEVALTSRAGPATTPIAARATSTGKAISLTAPNSRSIRNYCDAGISTSFLPTACRACG